MDDPADAGNALTAAAQCREAYWGAVADADSFVEELTVGIINREYGGR